MPDVMFSCSNDEDLCLDTCSPVEVCWHCRGIWHSEDRASSYILI